MRQLLLTLMALAILASPTAAADRIICASTTSTQNSGLYEHILPIFERKTGITVHVIAVGTGAALEMGKRGDADIVLVHAKDLELKGVEDGYFVNRHDLMYNYFMILGPAGSAGNFKGLTKAAEILRKISKEGLAFVSRGDESGTHRKELALWREAGISTGGKPWYLEAGQGMSKTIRIANEKRAYTLADRGTWLSMQDRKMMEMEIIFDGDPELFNQYGVMAVNPERHPHVKFDKAMALLNWLVSTEGQSAIGDYTDTGGNRLFTPNAD